MAQRERHSEEEGKTAYAAELVRSYQARDASVIKDWYVFPSSLVHVYY